MSPEVLPFQPPGERQEPLGVTCLVRLAELPAPLEGVPKHRVCKGCSLNFREVHLEVVLQKVFQKARRDGLSQVLLGMHAPPEDKLPDRFRVRLDELPDSDDGLPPGITTL